MSFDKRERIRSESVLLACTSDDGASGIFGRLCRYPSAGVAWVWLHAFLPGRVIGFADDAVPCGTDELATKDDDLTYVAADPVLMTLSRQGSRDGAAGASLSAAVPAHETTETPLGAGPVDLRVSATFLPEFAAGATLRGRSEVIGRVEATVSVDGEAFEIGGLGQWHEQHQHAPRFLQPFTYASVRGPSLALVGLGGPWGSYGFVRRPGGASLETSAVTFDGTRAIEVEAGSDKVRIEVEVVHGYSLLLYGQPWHGHQVRALGPEGPMSGFVNSWDGLAPDPR